jgi:hypothetical protein
MKGDQLGYLVTNNQSNSMLVDIRMSLSTICGDMTDDYMIRSNTITSLFSQGKSCPYYNEDEKLT